MDRMPQLPEGRRIPGRTGGGAPAPIASAPDLPVAAFDLGRALEAVRRHWLTVLVVLGLVAVPGVLHFRNEVPLYKAEATIRLRDVQGMLTGGLTGGVMGDLARSVDPVRSQIEVLTSRAVAAQVVDSTPELRLETIGFSASALTDIHIAPALVTDSVTLEFLPAVVVATASEGSRSAVYGAPLQIGQIQFTVLRPPGRRGVLIVHPAESVVDDLMSDLTVSPREQTDVIDVTYLDTDANRAQHLVNRVVSVYQSFNAAAAQQQSTRRRQFLEGQLKYHDSVLTSARAELSVFRGRQRAYSTKLRLSTEQTGMMQLQMERESMAADREIYRKLLDGLRSSGSAPDDAQVGAIMSAPGLATNPVVTELFSQLTRYQGARDSLTTGRFGRPASNPEVQQVDALIASARSKLRGAVESYLSSLDARIASLDQLRAQSSSAFPELSATEEEETGLEEQVEAARVTVAQLRTEYEKARLAEAVEVGQVEIVSLATVPRRPVGVSATRKSAFLMVVGLVLGLGAALLQDRFNRSLRRRGQVEELLNVAELAVIPAVRTGRRYALRGRGQGSAPHRVGAHRGRDGLVPPAGRLAEGLIVASDMHSIAAEAYRLLRTNLLFSLTEKSLRTVLVTSPAPGDGKTTVAANLAIAFAHQGMRVLLVDADLRRGRVHDLFHCPREPGLSQLLQNEITLEAAVRSTPVTGLYAMATGRLPDAPNELVGGENMRAFLTNATTEYALVVIDSPPVLAASDAAVMSTYSDATVVVIRAGRTHEEEIQRTLDQLNAVGGNVVGAVLNDPDSAIGAGGAYYYSEYYGKRSEQT